jgi:hypothetical protein
MALGFRCEKCGFRHYGWENCLKEFYFKHENWGKEFQKIGAYSFENAAERFGELFNEDGDLLDDHVEVIIYDGITEKTFIVSAEMEISYHVKEKE